MQTFTFYVVTLHYSLIGIFANYATNIIPNREYVIVCIYLNIDSLHTFDNLFILYMLCDLETHIYHS